MTQTKSITEVELSPYKWATHLDKLEKLANNKDIYPVTIELDLNGYCNHNCGWCVDPIHVKDSLDTKFVLSLINEMKSLGTEGIVFKGGGEGTLHQSYKEILNETKKLGFEIGIITNGSKLPELYESIVNNANYIRVSIDGPTKESHNKIHKSNDFDKIISGIKDMIELRNSLNQRHPVIGLSFAMDYSSIHLVNDAVKLGNELKSDYIMFRPPFFEEVNRPNTMTIEQKINLMSVFEKEKNAYNGKMNIFIDHWISDTEIEHFASKEDSPRRGKYISQKFNGIEHVTGTCLASPLMAIITADKKVYPCCNLRSIDKWNIGTLDYNNGETFEKIWNSEQRKEIMQDIKSIKCIKSCTHPMSKYNEIIEYLKSQQYHKGFV
jgi:MoaA/NifB/PqqE/SkfB family radical SAM enzyme